MWGTVRMAPRRWATTIQGCLGDVKDGEVREEPVPKGGSFERPASWKTRCEGTRVDSGEELQMNSLMCELGQTSRQDSKDGGPCICYACCQGLQARTHLEPSCGTQTTLGSTAVCEGCLQEGTAPSLGSAPSQGWRRHLRVLMTSIF